jgi:hypothetical protein
MGQRSGISVSSRGNRHLHPVKINLGWTHMDGLEALEGP